MKKRTLNYLLGFGLFATACQWIAPSLPQPSNLAHIDNNIIIGDKMLDSLLIQGFDTAKILFFPTSAHISSYALNDTFLENLLTDAYAADSILAGLNPVTTPKQKKISFSGSQRLSNLQNIFDTHIRLLIYDEFWLPFIENHKTFHSPNHTFLPIQKTHLQAAQDENFTFCNIKTADTRKIIQQLQTLKHFCHPDYRSGYRCMPQYQAVLNLYKKDKRLHSIFLSLHHCDSPELTKEEIADFVQNIIHTQGYIDGFCLN